jgi:metal-responsive CopG/Arc/MetJ family transcriptional regulator
MEAVTRVYISMPTRFLEQVDQFAEEEHQSRSGVIREALKMYMDRRRQALHRFGAIAQKFQAKSGDEPELEHDIDQAVAEVRGRRRRPN